MSSNTECSTMVIVGIGGNAGGIGFLYCVAETVPTDICASIHRGRVGGRSIGSRLGRGSAADISEGAQPAKLFRTQLLRHCFIAWKLRRLCPGLPRIESRRQSFDARRGGVGFDDIREIQII